jgi:SAM-dependent methyltransferase
MLARMDIREKMRRDWDRRAKVDPLYWVAATEEADEASYDESADRDAEALCAGLGDDFPKNGHVLDLGCGIGRMASRLTNRFERIVGVDVSPEMIEQANARYGALENVEFIANSGADLGPLTDGSFDLVYSYSVLPHLPVDVVESYFAEVNRVLKPGGLFRYQFWVGYDQQPEDNDTLTIRVYSDDVFEKLNAAFGFEVVGREEIDYLDPVLKLRPLWVNAKKVREASTGPRDFLERDGELSERERRMEYDLLLYLAVKHAERNETAEAERVLESAVAADPNRAEAYVEWAAHRLRQDDLKGARTLLVTLTERVPTEPLGWLYRAEAATHAGDVADADACLDALDKLLPTQVDAPIEIRKAADRLRGELSSAAAAPKESPITRAARAGEGAAGARKKLKKKRKRR